MFDSVNKKKKRMIIVLLELMILFASEFSRSFILPGNHARETGEWTDFGDRNSSADGMGAIK